MNPDVHALVGAFVVDALDAEERRQFEAHLARCEACRAEVGELAEVTAELAESVASPVSASLRARVLDAVDNTRQEPPAPLPQPATPRSMRRAPLVAAAILAVVAVASLTLWQRAEQRVGDERAARTLAEADADRLAELGSVVDELVTVAAAPDARRTSLTSEIGRLDAIWSGDTGQVVVTGSGVDPTPEDHRYALWLIDDTGPQLAGLFRPDERGRVLHVSDLSPDATIGVTLEASVSPSAPTGPVLASAPLA